MPHKANTPAIRFKGFTDAWEQHKLDNVSEIMAGGTPSTQVENYWFPKEIPWLSSGEVHKKRISYTDNMISKSGLANSSARWIKENSVLIALAGQGKTRGTVAINSIPLTTNQSIAAISLNKELHHEFVFQNLENRYEELRTLSSADGSRGGLNKQILSELYICTPKLQEQQKIGRFFENLDNLITLHQRKLLKLKNIKKAMLEKMFPQNGSNLPEIRFAGFTNAWEQRKLGDLADIVRGASPRPIKNPKWFDSESDIGWLRISDVTEQDGRIYFLEQRLSDEGQEKTRVLTDPHLLLSIAATVGKPLINYVSTGVHDGFLIFLNPVFDREFMFQWLEMFRPKWSKYGQPGSQVNLNSDLVKDKTIMLPEKVEQAQIGEFFANLDHLITLHQRKLEKFQNIKKSCLEKMFI